MIPVTYDFTSILERRGMDALAVDLVGRPSSPIPAPQDGFDPIPMWVADMNFPVLSNIQQAMIQRIQQPHFGYFLPRDEYFDAILRWQEHRNGVTGLTREHIGYENGVLGGVISALNVLCSRGDHVLVHSPTYIGFLNALSNNGYHVVSTPLVLDQDQVWRMDFEDMEQKLSTQPIHAAILCSPHNPCGRVWERWELERFTQLCQKYQIPIVSDEIWSDLTLEGHHHIPTQMVSDWAREHTTALYAPSKTFNLAGLVGSYHIVYNRRLRDRIHKESSLSHYNQMNLLSMYALMGAYCPEGEAWLDQLRHVLTGNVDFALDYIARHFPTLRVSRPQGTYMLFLDCSAWCDQQGVALDQLLRAGWKVGVVWQDGRPFHGPCHIRINLALPLSRVKEAFARLDAHVFHP